MVQTRSLVHAALMAALCALLTLFIRLPSPMGGYINLGDCAVLLSAWLLGPIPGALAAGIGSALADLMGYPLYAPATLVIKGTMAFLAGICLRCIPGRLAGMAVAGVAAEAVMVAGYWLFEAVILGMGPGAAVNIPFNLVQGAPCLAAALAVGCALNHSGIHSLR